MWCTCLLSMQSDNGRLLKLFHLAESYSKGNRSIVTGIRSVWLKSLCYFTEQVVSFWAKKWLFFAQLHLDAYAMQQGYDQFFDTCDEKNDVQERTASKCHHIQITSVWWSVISVMMLSGNSSITQHAWWFVANWKSKTVFFSLKSRYFIIKSTVFRFFFLHVRSPLHVKRLLQNCVKRLPLFIKMVGSLSSVFSTKAPKVIARHQAFSISKHFIILLSELYSEISVNN